MATSKMNTIPNINISRQNSFIQQRIGDNMRHFIGMGFESNLNSAQDSPTHNRSPQKYATLQNFYNFDEVSLQDAANNHFAHTIQNMDGSVNHQNRLVTEESTSKNINLNLQLNSNMETPRTIAKLNSLSRNQSVNEIISSFKQWDNKSKSKDDSSSAAAVQQRAQALEQDIAKYMKECTQKLSEIQTLFQDEDTERTNFLKKEVDGYMKLIEKHIESKKKIRERMHKKKGDDRRKRIRVKLNTVTRGGKSTKIFNVPNLGNVKNKGPNLSKKRFNGMVQRAAVLYNETIEQIKSGAMEGEKTKVVVKKDISLWKEIVTIYDEFKFNLVKKKNASSINLNIFCFQYIDKKTSNKKAQVKRFRSVSFIS